MASSDLESDQFIKQFCMPNYILVSDLEADHLPDLPECPILVFVNSRSGDQLGADLLITYRFILNKNQVKAVKPRMEIAVSEAGYSESKEGKKNPGTDRNSLLSFLDQLAYSHANESTQGRILRSNCPFGVATFTA
ncbi:Diacylglycerol kinase [Forsythia ovata]|uniref:Diacylglycerol kinase n=1 Tax=Forsythia ovata TaxID=205694 RepID=A0ABD1QF60_9LAMI